MPTSKAEQATEQRNKPGRPWLGDRDFEIVRAVYEYRFLLRDQIQALFFDTWTKKIKGEVVILPVKNPKDVANRRLERLMTHGYLHRYTVTDDPRLNARNTQGTYSLARKGALLLVDEGVMDEGDLRLYPDRNDVTPSYTLHMQAINDLRINLTLAAQANGDVIETWETEMELAKRKIKVTDPNDIKVTYPIRPDAFFVYRPAEQQKGFSFFLELDRRSERHKTFAEKVKGYIALQKSGKFTENFGAQSFRVLTVTKTEQNVHALKRTTEEAGGQRMFWFASFEALNKDQVLEPIWEVATAEGKYTPFKLKKEQVASSENKAAG